MLDIKSALNYSHFDKNLMTLYNLNDIMKIFFERNKESCDRIIEIFCQVFPDLVENKIIQTNEYHEQLIKNSFKYVPLIVKYKDINDKKIYCLDKYYSVTKAIDEMVSINNKIVGYVNILSNIMDHHDTIPENIREHTLLSKDIETYIKYINDNLYCLYDKETIELYKSLTLRGNPLINLKFTADIITNNSFYNCNYNKFNNIRNSVILGFSQYDNGNGMFNFI